MKKRFFSIGLISVLCLTSLFLLSGCGSKLYDYDLSEYVKLGDYKGLEYKKVSVSVSEDEVQDKIKTNLEEKAETKAIKSGTVKDGDTIDISYEGKVDGKTFDGGSADNQTITIGQSQFIDGFTDGLIGKEIGSKVKLNLTFPKDYSKEDLQGKDVVFEVTINSKQVEEVPEYDVAFVKKNSKYDNLKDYEKSVKEDLLKEKKAKAETETKQKLWETIVDKSEVKKYPEEELKTTEENLTKSFKQTAENYGYEWEDYLKAVGYTDKEFKKTVKKYAKEKVKQDMVCYYVAEKEGLEVTDDEYEDYMKNLMETSGYTEKTFKEQFKMTIEEYCDQEGYRTSLLLNKVMDKVMDYGKEVSK
ncbi:Trigger factor [uncultured Eubacterium sp.]|nr:Trigger factor [uncultured Eubacterium sp.]